MDFIIKNNILQRLADVLIRVRQLVQVVQTQRLKFMELMEVVPEPPMVMMVFPTGTCLLLLNLNLL